MTCLCCAATGRVVFRWSGIQWRTLAGNGPRGRCGANARASAIVASPISEENARAPDPAAATYFDIESATMM